MEAPCPRCQTSQTFLHHKMNEAPEANCLTCNGTLIITEIHSDLLKLGFIETGSQMDYKLLLHQDFNKHESITIGLSRNSDHFNVTTIDTKGMLVPDLMTAEQVINFLRSYN